MNRSTRSGITREASLTLWLAGAVLGGISCGHDEVGGPTATTEPIGSAASLSADGMAAPALSFNQLNAGKGPHTCGTTTDNRAYCWGYNASGQVGDGTFGTIHLTPSAVVGGFQFRMVTGGNIHTCALTTDNRAFCWGANGGRLGDGLNGARPSPVAVLGGLRFRQITAGMSHTCGLTTINRLYCWGTNEFGQLGDGTTITRLRPVAVAGGYSFRQVSAGHFHTCGVTTTYQTYCWGNNIVGRLGNGVTLPRKQLRPVAVAGTWRFKQVSAGYDHTCGVTTTNRAYCWGSGALGQIGDGKRYQRWTPRAVAGGLSFERVTAGQWHTCGETTGNLGYCWGLNVSGEIGDDNVANDRLIPVAIAGGLHFRQLSAGVLYTCGKTDTAVAYCWGSNGTGQLGDGTTTDRFSPVPVAGPM
jgi:alpha-tubulin suppressor-like RCC1 family protein